MSPPRLDERNWEVRALYADRNTRHWDFGGGNKPSGMASQAPGLNPSRWERRS